MDQTARNYFPDFDSDWANLGFLDAPQPPNLIGKIHPVFEKFRGEGKVRAYLGSDEEYERILPAIHLASNYLYSPSSRDFIYSLVYANRKPTGVNDEDGNPVTQLDKVEPCLYSSDRMNRIWEQLALHTDFGPRGLDDDNCAITYAKFYEDGVDLTGSGEICLPSRIYFGHRFLRDIDALHCSERAVSNEMLFVQLHLAMALCHEVAHAVDFGTIVKSPNPLDTVILPDPFFGDETVAELVSDFQTPFFPLGTLWVLSRLLLLCSSCIYECYKNTVADYICRVLASRRRSWVVDSGIMAGKVPRRFQTSLTVSIPQGLSF